VAVDAAVHERRLARSHSTFPQHRWLLLTSRSAGRVAAGAIAEKYLKLAYGIEIVAFVSSVGKIHMPALVAPSSTTEKEESDDVEDALSPEFLEILRTVSRETVDAHLTRCPHPKTAEKMTQVNVLPNYHIPFGTPLSFQMTNDTDLIFDSQRIVRAKDANDSIGGTITCVIRNVPSGLGEPVFDKFEATLAHAMLSIPATKAFEVGSGFRGTEVPGSKHNDMFVKKEGGGLSTRTNWSGGIQGGITNGQDIYFRYA
jgi:chorismate synthase